MQFSVRRWYPASVIGQQKFSRGFIVLLSCMQFCSQTKMQMLHRIDQLKVRRAIESSQSSHLRLRLIDGRIHAIS